VAPPRDLLRVEAAPYIRPIAELKDEYEPFVVVTADNRQARIYQVISAKPAQEERVKGDVKNQVKKGGWSQKRYQRRRKNELLHYAKDVVSQLESIVSEAPFERIVLLGQPEALGEIKAAMPEALIAKIAGERNVDLDGDEDALLATAFELYTEQERRDETALWDRIRGEYYADGLAAAGPRDVLGAALEGRVDTMIVNRDAKISGMRCRDCEVVAVAKPQQCPSCKSTSVFEVDLIEELVHQLEKTSADVEFVDPIEGLSELGGVAALLRW
jgi:peptide chain release factor subunit 1